MPKSKKRTRVQYGLQKKKITKKKTRREKSGHKKGGHKKGARFYTVALNLKVMFL